VSEPIHRLASALAVRYQIERQLGQGGMATAYLAQDLKHDRKVAIKVLRPELAAVLGADRFVQEIKTTANLQHPNILPLFDSGEASGFLHYVMPYVDGETLRDKLNREKQLGIQEAVRIAMEVAEALDYAHRQDVIHRDIKPENILLHDGRPLVADFGIALAVSAAAGGRMTETGLSLGTPHYMSPEQATGEKDITRRSDIYSLGAVLYEMLTGDPPHTGSTAQQIIMRIVTDETRPVSEIRKSVPPNVGMAVAKALEKLPADRFDSPKSFGEALTDPHFTSATTRVTASSRRRWSWNRQNASLVAVVGIMTVAAAWGWLRPPPPAPTVVRFTVPVPGGFQTSFGEPNLAVDPAGQTLVYPVGWLLYARRIGDWDAFPLPGTERAEGVFFSPDGRSVGFWQDGALKRVSLDGAPPTVIDPNAGVVMGASWGEDGSIVYAPYFGTNGLFRVASDGGTDPIQITNVADSLGETGHRWPTILPGGRQIVYTTTGRSGGWDDASIIVHDLDTGRHKTLRQGVTYARYLPTGHLLFVEATGAILAAPFDLGDLDIVGSSVAVVPQVRLMAVSGGATYAVSNNGTLTFVRDSIWTTKSLMWRDRTGRTQGQLGPGLYGNYVTVSPDGRRVALTIRSARNDDIFWIDVETGERQRASIDLAEDETPIWSPDGARIAYSSQGPGHTQRINVMSAVAGSMPTLLYEGANHIHLSSWSPDGRWLALFEFHPERASDIWALSLDSTSTLLPIDTTAFDTRDAAFSPDGRWVAYSRGNEIGRHDLWVASFPDPTYRQPITTTGGVGPRWSPDGRELFFFRGDTLMVIPVSTGASFRLLGSPRAVLRAPDMAFNDLSPDYAISPDGSRFLFVTDNADAAPKEIHVVLNFFEELRERVGRGS